MNHISFSSFALLSLVIAGCPGAAPNSDGLDDTGTSASSGGLATSSGGPATGSTSQGVGGDVTSGGGAPSTTSGAPTSGTAGGGGDGGASGGGDPATTSGGGDPTGGSGGGGGDGGAGGATSGSGGATSGSGGAGGYVPGCGNGTVDPGEMCFDAAPTHYAGPRIPIPADVDGNGTIDLASTSAYFPNDASLRICPGNGNGTFDVAACVDYPGRANLSFARLGPGPNGLDVIGSNNGDQHTGIVGRRGDGFQFTWTFLEPAGAYDNVAAGDMDGDGDADLVLVQKTPRVRVFLNDGNGGFPTTPNFDANVGCATDRAPLVADFDEDGALDVFVSCFFAGVSTPDPSLRVLRGNGTGGLGEAIDQRFAYPDGFSMNTTQGDLDGDGNVDVVLSWRSDITAQGSFEILFGFGDGTFDDPVRLLPPAPALAIDTPRLADLDQDGNADLIGTTFVSPSLSRAYVFRGDGTGSFAAGELLFPNHVTANGNASLGVTAVDLNGDGALDLVRGSPTSDVNLGQGLDVFLATP